MERKRGCKIRKRSCSSSSSSSLLHRNRFKRAIFAGKRVVHQDSGGSVTPVKSITAVKTPLLFSFSPEKLLVDQFQNSCVSARKLAATLWEISDSTDTCVYSNKDCLRVKETSRNRGVSSHDFPPKSSNPISRLGSQRMDVKEDKIRRRDNLQLIEHKNSVKERLTTSKELINVLKKVGEEHKKAKTRLISALTHEIDCARSALKQVMRECEEERKKLKEEVKMERKQRKKTEKMKKKLERELMEVKEEKEREKRSKEVLEEICDELAKGIGEDKAEIERVKGEVEKEREMMHIADVLREERVQMKLMEAKFELQDKHAAVERLRTELRRLIDVHHEEESDCKSIELNMESYKWGYVKPDDNDDDGDDDHDDSDDDGGVKVGFDNGERDETIKNLRDYIVSNVRFIGPSSSGKVNHRSLPSSEFV